MDKIYAVVRIDERARERKVHAYKSESMARSMLSRLAYTNTTTHKVVTYVRKEDD